MRTMQEIAHECVVAGRLAGAPATCTLQSIGRELQDVAENALGVPHAGPYDRVPEHVDNVLVGAWIAALATSDL